MMTRELTSILEHKPVLWVGAGLSVAAGYPSLDKVLSALRAAADRDLVEGDFTQVVDDFVAKMSRGRLANVLQRLFQRPHEPTETHKAIARLAAAGRFTTLVTTNYDDLLERALAAAGVEVLVEVLEQNASLREQGGAVRLMKIHGSYNDWAHIILSGNSYATFEARYGFLRAQLDVLLQQHPLLFVGCSLQDPRVLSWLESRPDAWAQQLEVWRAIMRPSAWSAAQDMAWKGGKASAVLSRAPLRPIEIERHEDLPALWLEVAKKLAPLAVNELVFDVDPGETEWRSVGPTPESAPHVAPSPLRDDAFVRDLHRLRGLMRRPVFIGRPQSPAQLAELRHVARQVGSRLTTTLLSADARAAVQRRLAEVDRGPARLTLRIVTGPRADAALALPWELLMPEDGRFAVEDAKLDLVRDAVTPGAPGLEVPSTTLAVAATIAAPDDQVALRFEDESFRVLKALAPLGQAVHFADLGEVDDLVDLTRRTQATAIHFSGHGLPGELVFEDELGLSQRVRVADLMTRLRQRVHALPRLFFLASCYGASSTATPGGGAVPGAREVRAEVEAALGEGPSTAATLHREGFACVLGYFGPIGDAVSTAAEVALYTALAQGDPVLSAAKQARSALVREQGEPGARYHYPLGWAQLAVYLRGADQRLTASPQPANNAPPAPPQLEREMLEVSGLPVLEHGFIGRRALQHEVRRKYKEGQRLFVLQGLGGLGKTALASQLLCKLFAHDRRDQLILRITESTDLTALRTQAEAHGEQFEDWADELKGLHERFPDPVEGFQQAVLALRRHRPQLVLYADNMEWLQVGPGGAAEAEPGALGTWKPGAERWWAAMVALARGGVVLASTRYQWRGLSREALVALDRMSRADLWRMLETFEKLRKLPWSVRETLTGAADGRPRTIQLLDDLLGQAHDDPTRSLEEVWTEHVAPVLAQHGAELTGDLLLAKLWRLLSQDARDHAVAAGVLEAPAPRSVLDVLGPASGELLRAGLLTRHREVKVAGTPAAPKFEWEDRWSMHASVRQFVLAWGSDDVFRHARTRAAKKYAELVAQPGARWGDQLEAIRLYLEAGDATAAWPLACKYVLWLRRRAQYAAALAMLETFTRIGLVGDYRAEHVSLLAMTRRDIGMSFTDMASELQESLASVASPEVKAKVFTALASAAFRQGKNAESQRLVQDAAALLGDDNPARAFSEPLRAQLEDRLEDAERLYEELLHNDQWMVQARQRRMSHPVIGGLGRVRVLLGKDAEAEPVLLEALAVGEHELGPDHPNLCWILSDLAIAVACQGRVQEGLSLLERALAIALATHREDHPDVKHIQDLLRQLQAPSGSAAAPEPAAAPTPAEKKNPKIGKNDPCPCGSGKPYRKCHGKEAAT